MKKILTLTLILLFTVPFLFGCGKKSLLSKSDPVTLTLWHTYGEQATSPMNVLVSEFNKTVGRENGVFVSVKLITSAAKVGEKLSDAQIGTPGALDMPDLFFCHAGDAAKVGTENLIDWNDLFSEEERAEFITDFIGDGTLGETLTVLPVSKSTHVCYINGAEFERFSAATGVTYDSLSTWDGFFDAAEKYREYSGGKPFAAFDYLIRAVELDAISHGASAASLYEGDYYNFENEALKASYTRFAAEIAKENIIVSELYSNTQVMTGDVPVGIGSSAAVLYYGDTVSYADGTSEPLDLHIIPLPSDGDVKYATQAGVGLCALKTTDKKAEAASLFAHWLTDDARNLEFAAETGYMPVKTAVYESIYTHEFEKPSYEALYVALAKIKEARKFIPEPNFTGYYGRINALYDSIRVFQNDLPKPAETTEQTTALTNELWDIFTLTKINRSI